MEDDIREMQKLGRRGDARREAWKSQRVFAAREAIRLFMALPTYSALWSLRARLNELLEDSAGNKNYFWAGVDAHSQVFSRGAFDDIVRVAEESHIPDPNLWLIVHQCCPTQAPKLKLRVRTRTD